MGLGYGQVQGMGEERGEEMASSEQRPSLSRPVNSATVNKYIYKTHWEKYLTPSSADPPNTALLDCDSIVDFLVGP